MALTVVPPQLRQEQQRPYSSEQVLGVQSVAWSCVWLSCAASALSSLQCVPDGAEAYVWPRLCLGSQAAEGHVAGERGSLPACWFLVSWQNSPWRLCSLCGNCAPLSFQVHRCQSDCCGEKMGFWHCQVLPGGGPGTSRDSALGRAVSCRVLSASGLPEVRLP